MTCGVNKTAPGGTRSEGGLFLSLPGTHGPLVDGDRDRKGDDSLRDAEPELDTRDEQNEIVPCQVAKEQCRERYEQFLQGEAPPIYAGISRRGGRKELADFDPLVGKWG